MKKIQKLVPAFFFALLLIMAQNSFAGTTPSYFPESNLTAGDQAGASCPTRGDSGLFILLGLGAAYVAKKMYDYRKSFLKEEGGGNGE